MSSNDIRLRLTIRRHALPELKLVWPCTVSDDLTIANLLSEVNEVVTLESGDWGLEDYAVELADGQGASFECMHFQQVGKIFKHDDQVLIRSLLTEDLRRRRVSGRYQISADGIHLVDGVPFGRRRAPRNRPALSLPPRKRARIIYEPDEENDEESPGHEVEQPQRLLLEDSRPHRDALLSAGVFNKLHDDEYEDQDYPSDSGSENEAGYKPDADDSTDQDDENEGLEEEIRLLQADNDIIGDNGSDEDFGSGDNRDMRDTQHTSTSTQNSPQRLPGNADQVAPAAVAALRTAFPLTSATTIETTLRHHQMDIRRSYYELASDNDPAVSFDDVLDGFLANRFQPPSSPASSALLPQAHKTSSRPLIQEIESEDPPVSLTTGPNGKLPNTHGAKDRDDGTTDDTSSSGSDSGSDNRPKPEIDIDEGSSASSIASSGSDSSDSSSSENEDGPSRKGGHQRSRSVAAISSEDESSGPEDDSEGTSESSESHGGVGVADSSKNRSVVASDNSPSTSSDDSSSSDDESSSMSEGSDSGSEPEEAPAIRQRLQSKPTHSHGQLYESDTNQIANVRAPASREKTVGRGQGLSKTQKRNARRREAKRLRNLEQPQSQPFPTDDANLSEHDLLARKQALLNAVTEEFPEVEQRNRTRDEAMSDVPRSQQSTSGHEVGNIEEQDSGRAPENCPESATSPKDEVTRRRMRVDMGAGRRLLFGALGLKNPKNKSDEDKLKENLMKDVRPLKNHRLGGPGEMPKDSHDVESETCTENWHDKITYRAVECCHDGIVLSEPPFPFVQRWDPQQQYGSMRKRKRKSQNFNQGDDYDESYWYNDRENDGISTRQSKKSKTKFHPKRDHMDLPNGVDDNIELNYDDTPAKSRGTGSQFTDVDDLPSLPADVSSLPMLQVDEVKPGMVITWKEFQLSKKTNWQPELLSLTGLIVSISDEHVLQLVLAKRDRKSDDKVYDEETGQRIYDKFEVPDDSEDEDKEEDDGLRDISWCDLIEPRVVQREPSPSVLNSPMAQSRVQMEAENTGAPEEGMETGSPRPRDSSVNDIDSIQVRAVVEIPMNEEHEVSESTSIPSGQDYPHLPIPAPSVGGPTNSDNSRAEASQAKSAESAEVVIKDSQPAGRQESADDETTSLEASNANLTTQLPGGDAMMVTIGSGPKSALQKAPSTRNASAILEDQDRQQTPTVNYPQLPVPSSISSVCSGRQPQSENGFPAHASTVDDTMNHETSTSALYMEPKQESPHKTSEGDTPQRNSSPFPSLDEIWHTAQTSKQIQSPQKSSQMSALEKWNNSNGEHDEAMQRLDEGEDSDSSPDRNKSIRSLFPNATQPPRSVNSPQLFGGKKSVGRPLRRSQRRSSPFQIPEGSQVITVSSSPGSSNLAEENVEDNPGKTNEDNDLPLLSSSGWVKKSGKSETGTPKRETRGRRKSMPADAPETQSDKKSLPSPSSADVMNQRSGRRRTSRKL